MKHSFPLIDNNPGVTYLDSASTSIKPQCVLDEMSRYYEHFGVNVHRGLYDLSDKATEAFENARSIIARHIHASSPQEIICVKSATEGINLIASTFGNDIIDSECCIVTTVIDHHANFVPWQQLAHRKGAEFRVVDCLDSGDVEFFQKGPHNEVPILSDSVRIVALPYVSNVLGTILPLKDIISKIRRILPHVYVVVDATQALAHIPIDVQELDCDFLVFSGHKMYGPTGIGIVWGRSELLARMGPYQFGGDMVKEVHIDTSSWAEVPYRFEAGTPPIAEMIGLGAACSFIQDVGYEYILQHDSTITDYLMASLRSIHIQMHVLGDSSNYDRIGIAAWHHDECHPHDIASLLSEDGVAVRAGHHCAMPLHTRFHIPASTRASISLVTTERDIDLLCTSLKKAYAILCPSTQK